MSERKSWSSEQDNALRYLYEEKGIRKWAEIARSMQNEFGIKKRSGKQCRERYSNHLDKSIKREEWTRAEEQELIRIHNSVGNRWAEISRAISGRSQTCVKNKFYSILRRGLRYINKVIKTHYKKYKQLDIAIVFKIVEACEHSYKLKTLTKEMLQNLQIKKEVIFYGMNGDCKNLQHRNEVRSLVDKIKNFKKQNRDKKYAQEEENDEDEEEQEVRMKQGHSEQEIDSAEYRDNCCPIIEVKESKPRKQSFQRVCVFQDHDKEHQDTQSRYSACSSLSKLIVQLEKDTTKSYDMFEKTPREGQAGDWTIKSFDVPDYDFARSPRQMVFMDSPYFDQLRANNSNNSFSQFYPQ